MNFLFKIALNALLLGVALSAYVPAHSDTQAEAKTEGDSEEKVLKLSS
jgi:hypothetical protein